MRFSKQGNVVFERVNFASYKESILLLTKSVFCFLYREDFAGYVVEE